MQKINLRELYPDIYKTDTYLEVTDEVQAVFLADKRAEARYLRQMYNYGIENNNAGGTAMVNAPLYFVRNGNISSSDGRISNAGGSGNYWIGAPYGSDRAKYMYFFSSHVYTNNDFPRIDGFSVRCVADWE